MPSPMNGAGGYTYLYEPLWWIGMITMIAGEIANFAAYAFAPAILVTPLGALSIIISAALAHAILQEKLHSFGILGCALCVVGSTTIVLHAPQEREIESVKEVWDLATEPAFLLYAAIVITAVVVIIIRAIPHYGQTHVMVYISICSLMGSLSVCYECQSTWNCFEADILGNESVTIPPNMGPYLGCTHLCNHSNQLLKQGS
ncbi:hypothetical protein OIU78_022958 [Salix suchowensis]|nr:hypothetical protein OIU78_022958 [Salix suchowensis]